MDFRIVVPTLPRAALAAAIWFKMSMQYLSPSIIRLIPLTCPRLGIVAVAWPAKKNQLRRSETGKDRTMSPKYIHANAWLARIRMWYYRIPFTSTIGVPASAEPLTRSARLAITSSILLGVVPSVALACLSIGSFASLLERFQCQGFRCLDTTSRQRCTCISVLRGTFRQAPVSCRK